MERPLQVRGREHDLVDAVTREVIQDVRERGPVHQGQQRLRRRLGQRAQARPLPADEHHRLHRGHARSRAHSSSARSRRADHANGSVSRRHPRARCLR